MSETKDENPNWQMVNTHPLLIQPLVEALSEVNDPEIRLNIVQLGLVRDVIIENNEVTLVMILTTPFCPYGPSLLESARQKAEKAVGMPTKVDFRPEPWLPEYLADEYQGNFGFF